MAKRVVIVASGETERRALPHLARHLERRAVAVQEVRVPPRNKALTGEMVAKLIRAAWFENLSAPPDKFVVVLDLDGADPDDSLAPVRGRLPGRRDGIEADVLCAYAQEHLEAWYFADSENLRSYLGRELGQVDASRPDEIRNPKLHLRHLLGERVYTARVSEEIASRLDADTIAGRSPSFRKLVDAITNGKSESGVERRTSGEGRDPQGDLRVP